MSENWRPIPDFSAYEVSDLGRVRSTRGRWGSTSPRILSGTVEGTSAAQYRRFILQADDPCARRAMRAHELVLLAFVGPRPDGLVTRHVNGDSLDNRLCNLAYGTYSENGLDAVAHGHNFPAYRDACVHGHVYTTASFVWNEAGRVRLCLICRAINNRNSSARRSARRAAKAGAS